MSVNQKIRELVAPAASAQVGLDIRRRIGAWKAD
jgi:hypothetical protein